MWGLHLRLDWELWNCWVWMTNLEDLFSSGSRTSAHGGGTSVSTLHQTLNNRKEREAKRKTNTGYCTVTRMTRMRKSRVLLRRRTTSPAGSSYTHRASICPVYTRFKPVHSSEAAVNFVPATALSANDRVSLVLSAWSWSSSWSGSRSPGWCLGFDLQPRPNDHPRD